MKHILVFLFCFLVLTRLLGQETAAPQIDSSIIEGVTDTATDNAFEEANDEEYADGLFLPEPAYMPADSIASLRRKPEYSYIENLDSLLRNFKMDVAENKKNQPPSKSIFDIGLVKLLIWSLAIFAVLFILYQLFAGQQNLFYRNKKLEAEAETGDTPKSEASHLVLSQQAASRGDYRQAVRHQYSYILQLMGEKQLIHLQPQKTNDHYLREVRQKPLASDFARLTLQFEYVWYGEFNLNTEQYETIAAGYRKFIGTWL
jgi:hypothetical protein